MKKAASKAFVGIVLAVLAIVTLLPVIWVLISSLKTRKEMMTLPWGLPEVFQWENYTKAWEKADFQILMKNSICITAVSLVFMILLSSMMAFAITRYHVRARKLVLMYMLVGQTISTGMITFPIVILLRKLGLDGGLAGLILTPMIGWTGGTLAGGILTSFLPTIVTNALSIALYGMFIAVIIPPSRKKKSVLFTVLFAVLLSCCFHYFPVFSVLSGGWGIIVITLVVSAVAAVLFPIEVEEVHE